jgi:hypothetical protein
MYSGFELTPVDRIRTYAEKQLIPRTIAYPVAPG